jgi:divalent metal cation (Fe/Co/Zn/Cd) transporter
MLWKLLGHIAFGVSIAMIFFGIGMLVEAVDHWKDIRRRAVEAALMGVVMLACAVALLVVSFL